MFQPYRFIFTLLLFAVTASGVSALTWQEKTDRQFRKWDRTDSPGCAIIVVKDGEVIHQNGYGMANLRYDIPIDPETTIFRTASNSKQYVAFAILLLHDEGLLTLDDDIRDYIPESPDFGETITIRHLLHHVSGIRDYLSLASMSGLVLMNDYIDKTYALEMFENQQRLNFAPGDQTMYSNTGFTLLGEIVARVSGQSLSEFCRERIFEPLGMTNTFFIDNFQTVYDNFADAYIPDPEGNTWHSTIGFSSVGAAGMASTVVDLAKWDENFYNPVVGNSTIIKMMEQKFRLNDRTLGTMSMGLIVEEALGIKVVYHGGDLNGFHCQTMRFPNEHFSMIFLSNTAELNSGELATMSIQIRSFYLQEPDTSVTDFQLHEPTPPMPAFLSGFIHPDLDMMPYLNPPAYAPKARAARPSQAKPQLTEPQVRRYVGRYYSEELDVFYELALEDGYLMFKTPRIRPGIFGVDQVDSDGSFVTEVIPFIGLPAFWGTFTEDGSGNIDGFLLSNFRVIDLKFIKVTTAPFD
ncbi:MAG: serine hydrolase domain-containing protein [Candidatus Hinthialibacter antarcticus]|nr:serine hydrolase domain-containing protein [Candidatus Hinthialibacter antarcticus]